MYSNFRNFQEFFIKKIKLNIFNLMIRSRMRSGMRGYSFLVKNSLEAKIEYYKQSLTDINFSIPDIAFNECIFGKNLINQKSLILKQFLCFRLMRIEFNKQIVLGLSNKKIIYPMPNEWRSHLISSGLKISRLSIILWWGYLILFYFYGILIFLKYLNFIILNKNNNSQSDRYFYFTNLDKFTITEEKEKEKKYTTLNWFIKYYKNIYNIDSFKHSVGVDNTKYYLDGRKICVQKNFTTFNSNRNIIFFKFINWGVIVIPRVFIDLLIGRWWNVLMFSEGVKLKLACLSEKKSVASKYFFSNTNPIYRPLWTYEMEKKGSEIVFFFYSAHQDFYRGTGVVDNIPYSYRILNWNKYLVWDEYQKDFLVRAKVNSLNINVVGPIWHTDSEADNKINSKNYIAVFDITPYRSSQLYKQGADVNFLNETVMIKFLNDISSLAKKFNIKIIYKKKRDSWRHSKKYKFELDKMSAEGHITRCDSNISAIKILKNSFASISFPYTSTALISRELGKRSIYYDPVGILTPNIHLTHGVNLISGKDELERWLTEELSRSKYE